MCGSSLAAEISPVQREFFEAKIRPVLVNKCYECHSTEAKKLGGKLLLDTPQGILRGGESGPAIVVGKPKESLLVQAMHYDGFEMPPENPLAEMIIHDFERWIADGAPDPRVEKSAAEKTVVAKTKLWSLQPRGNPSPPNVSDVSWPRDTIDHFVLSQLEKKKLQPTGDADAETLARRLYHDLIGLAPTHAELQTFVNDHRNRGHAAVEDLVDQLLSMPEFGQRWGRHWLDVARYGESNGDDGLGRNATFPHAWRYRDYVIDAFNRDTPYDRFLQEQIAGDLLPASNAEQRNRNLIATGFLAIGSKPAAAMNKYFPMDIVDDQINVVGSGLLGLSVSCARCHDHKHDPISTRDYYALAGVFKSTETLYGLAGNEKLTAPPTPLVSLVSEWDENSVATTGRFVLRADYGAHIDALKPTFHVRFDKAPEGLQTKGVKYSATEFGTVKDSSILGQLKSASEDYSVSFWFKNSLANTKQPITAYLFSRAKQGDKALPGDHLGIGGTHKKERTGKLFVFNGNNEKVSIAGTTVIAPNVWHHITLIRQGERVRLFLNGNAKPEIDTQLKPTFGESTDFSLAARSDRFAPLEGQLAEFAIFESALSNEAAVGLFTASGRKPTTGANGLAMGVRDRVKAADCKVHINGDGAKLGPVAPRGFLVSSGMKFEDKTKFTELSSGRMELAHWVTSPQHPLTARVMTNRIWLQLFGRGIVDTPNDFGVYGSRPTHPALLDHLANRFIQEGWSIKRLIRAIVLSRTYQLASECKNELVKADPTNRFYARHTRRRLDAETLRDRLLQASGELDREPAIGSSIQDVDQLINWPIGESTNYHRPSRHRSVYLCMLRHAPPPEIAAFDLPTGVEVVGQRNVTTLPSHSLYLLNNPLVIQQARLLSRQIKKASDDSERVRSLYLRAFQRIPNENELARALQFIEQSRASDTEKEDRPPNPRLLDSWESLCQALLISNEFRYID